MTSPGKKEMYRSQMSSPGRDDMYREMYRSHMTPHSEGELLLRSVYRAILFLCLIFVIWFTLNKEEINQRRAWLRPRQVSGGQFSVIVNRHAQGKPEIKGHAQGTPEIKGHAQGTPEIQGGDKVDKVFAWRDSVELVTSTLKRLLLGKLERYMVLGLLNEEGTLRSEFVSSNKFVDQDIWEENILAGEVIERIVARKHEKIPGEVKTFQFEMCPAKMKDHIPCLDDLAAIKQLPDVRKGEKWERRCPNRASRMCCIIPRPAKYRTPITWPRSKDEVWAANVPRPRRVWNDTWITIQKDKLRFSTNDVPFANGMDGYLDQLAQMVPNLAFGVRTRTTLDVGCGVAGFGAALLARGVLPLSIAAKGSHNNEVQLALERGLPAMVAAFASRRLLYPSQAFDLIHCSQCEVEWTSNGGVLLLESNRLLRAGGYFAWAGLTDGKSGEATWHEMEDLANRLCWTLVAKEESLAVWQKPHRNTCYQDRAPGALPPMCDESDDPDAVWYFPLRQCISWLPANVINENVSDWPARLSPMSKRLGVPLMYTEEARGDVFVANQRHWNEIVSGYLRGLGLKKEHVRNVMDMRAGYGGFAAALVDQQVDWWVMNVVSAYGPNSLTVIYDRGLLGVAHDWCEPFDTYPRTYDLLHAVGLFTAEEPRCNIAHIILEMDRILRPGGWVLIRESKAMATKVEALAKSVHWKTRILETESGPYGKDKLLSCIKPRR